MSSLEHISSNSHVNCAESSENKGTTSESLGQHRDANTEELGSSNKKYKKVIYGEEALKISPMAPYTLHRPIRRGHLNISLHYPMQQVQFLFSLSFNSEIWIHFGWVAIVEFQLHMGSDYIFSYEVFGMTCDMFHHNKLTKSSNVNFYALMHYSIHKSKSF